MGDVLHTGDQQLGNARIFTAYVVISRNMKHTTQHLRYLFQLGRCVKGLDLIHLAFFKR